MASYAFISHSSRDKVFVDKLATELRSEQVWVDMWNMDIGDPLASTIEHGIERAAEFIIVLSENSLNSNWVRYEANMALIRHLEDENFRIITVRIDNCTVPLRFKPFLYVDSPGDPEAAINITKDVIRNRRATGTDEAVIYRRHFVDRSDEIGQIEQHVLDPDVRIVCVNGFLGIGKTALVKESALRLWQRPQLAEFSLTSAHIGPRLALELCAAAELPIPREGAAPEELENALLQAAETLISQGRILMFNQFESVLDDDGVPQEEVLALLRHVSSIALCSRVPVFILSRRWPRLAGINSERVGYISLRGLPIEHMVTILESEASRVQRKEYSDSNVLTEIGAQLFGYPLAGRLAAPLLVKYSPEYILSNLQHIVSLRVDIAESVLAHSNFNNTTVQVLHLLALFDGPLAVDQLARVLERSTDSIHEDIDVLADHNVVELEGTGVRLHPLVSDFYWKQIRSDKNFKEYANRLAEVAQDGISATTLGTTAYISSLTNASRLMLLSGNLEGWRSLRKDLLGELKLACVELYQRQEYELSLTYCNEYLDSNPNDFTVRFHKARCLSRLDEPAEAHKILDELLADSSLSRRPRKKARLSYAKGRTYSEQHRLQQAQDWYLKAISLSPDYLAPLQGVSEVLLRNGNLKEAEGFLERALERSPMDSFALSLYADVLWQQGRYEEAIQSMGLALKSQPNNASFLFRIGRFHQDAGNLQQARRFFTEAINADSNYFDARLSFASVCIDLGDHEKAKLEIEALKPNLAGDKRLVIQNIEAQCELATGNLDDAERISEERLRRGRDVPTLGMAAKIALALSKRSREQGLEILAQSHRQRAEALLNEGLELDPDNPHLQAEKSKLSEP